jgi:hypothetical protein
MTKPQGQQIQELKVAKALYRRVWVPRKNEKRRTVKLYLTQLSNCDLHKSRYFMGELSRERSEELLKFSTVSPAWLLRYSVHAQEYVVSYTTVEGGKIHHLVLDDSIVKNVKSGSEQTY